MEIRRNAIKESELMKGKGFGLELKMEEGTQLVGIQLDKEVGEYLFELAGGTTYVDYLKEFLNSEEKFDRIDRAFTKAMDDSLPQELKEKCENDIDDAFMARKLCYFQMQATFDIILREYVNIILNHKHIYDNKIELQRLTINFFDCLCFVKGKGVMFIDLERLSRYALDANFKSLSQIFKNSSDLRNLQIINKSLDALSDEEMEIKTFQKEDENYIGLQKEFFENKLRFYKDKIFIEERENNKAKTKNNNKRKKTTIPHYALYYYYLQQNGDFGFFENHPNGKVAAIKELIEEEKIATSYKYFQKVYNKITHYKTNRIAKNQVANIDFVANVMLEGFPKAQKIALSELKEAKTKNK